MLEHFFQCPYCWKEISMLLDSSTPQQSYVEDCENCCNPIVITLQFQHQELATFQAEQLDK